MLDSGRRSPSRPTSPAPTRSASWSKSVPAAHRPPSPQTKPAACPPLSSTRPPSPTRATVNEPRACGVIRSYSLTRPSLRWCLPCCHARLACGRFGSRSLEEVFVDLLEGVGLLNDHAAVVLDHESGQFGSVDEDQTSVHPLGIVTRIGAEPAGCDEDAPACLRTVQGTDEGLDVWPSYMAVGESLGLHVDDVQPELVQSYEAVQASVAG